MKLPNLKMQSVPPSPVQAVGGSQAGTKEVKIGINPTPLRGKVRIHPKLLAIWVDIPAWKTFGGCGRSRGRGRGGPAKSV